ncbi:hypothetical protein H2198_002383 [Neophaeococcomyces mojaviensis]|uniref:Uncharacterized protein n=1 Tax=Neophaeococcomyces mojaviensis TaxID=3383035 RepID=A0ACC3AE30_9EURO|nr:hypothetical protein H2198_002383 [Knufia sp. JES_112]
MEYASTVTTYTTEKLGVYRKTITCALPDPYQATYPYAWMTATGTALQEELAVFSATRDMIRSTATFTGCPLGMEFNTTFFTAPFTNSSMSSTGGQVTVSTTSSLHGLRSGPAATNSRAMVYTTENIYVFISDGSAAPTSTETAVAATFPPPAASANTISLNSYEPRMTARSHSFPPHPKAWETSPRPSSSTFLSAQTPTTPHETSIILLSYSSLHNQAGPETHSTSPQNPNTHGLPVTFWILATLTISVLAVLTLWGVLAKRRQESHMMEYYTTKPPRPGLKRLSLVGKRRGSSPAAVMLVSGRARRGGGWDEKGV